MFSKPFPTTPRLLAPSPRPGRGSAPALPTPRLSTGARSAGSALHNVSRMQVFVHFGNFKISIFTQQLYAYQVYAY